MPMKCVDWDETRKVKWENPPQGKEGPPRKVWWITRRKKCSEFRDNLTLEESDCEETEMLLLDAEDETDAEENDAEDISPEELKEHFKRFLKGIIT